MATDAGPVAEPERETVPSPSAGWARCMRRTFEIDLLVCPKCGSPMKIKAFITNRREIDRITKNLGIAYQRAPFG